MKVVITLPENNLFKAYRKLDKIEKLLGDNTISYLTVELEE